MRLFVGVPLDDIVRRYVYDVSNALRGKMGRMRASWVKEENYHITLMFIGEVPDEEVETIKTKLSSVRFTPFTLTLSNVGYFGSPPKVLWVGVQSSEKLTDLASQVNNLLGGNIDRFHPHITLARIKGRAPSVFYDTVDSTRVKPLEWNVDRFILFRSQLAPGGSIYTPLEIYYANEGK